MEQMYVIELTTEHEDYSQDVRGGLGSQTEILVSEGVFQVKEDAIARCIDLVLAKYNELRNIETKYVCSGIFRKGAILHIDDADYMTSFDGDTYAWRVCPIEFH